MMSLMDIPEEVENSGQLDLRRLTPSSRLVIETDNGRLMLVLSGPVDPSKPSDATFQVIDALLDNINLLRSGQTVKIRGPIYVRRVSLTGKVIRDRRLAISGEHFRINLCPIRHVWVNGQQIF